MGDVVLGQRRDVERCAARALVTAGLASREDWMLTFVGGAPATRCNIGWSADRTAADPDRGESALDEVASVPTRGRRTGQSLQVRSY
jgi:hypothetical protein